MNNEATNKEQAQDMKRPSEAGTTPCYVSCCCGWKGLLAELGRPGITFKTRYRYGICPTCGNAIEKIVFNVCET